MQARLLKTIKVLLQIGRRPRTRRTVKQSVHEDARKADNAIDKLLLRQTGAIEPFGLGSVVQQPKVLRVVRLEDSRIVAGIHGRTLIQRRTDELVRGAGPQRMLQRRRCNGAVRAATTKQCAIHQKTLRDDKDLRSIAVANLDRVRATRQ